MKRAGTDTTTVLYARIRRDIHNQLAELADETGLTLAMTAEVVLMAGLGVSWAPVDGVRKLTDILMARRLSPPAS